ncbi:MAG: capsule biosynthesis protein CapA, partial [Pseudomonadota bacterium]
MSAASGRVFLFLQGPHGPFFRQLAQALTLLGAEVHRAAFNAADEAAWRKAGPLHRFNDTEDAFEVWLNQQIDAHGVTDIVLYGDTRPVHKMARAVAHDRDLHAHCFEEGYIRPSWITYERDGNNGNSRLMSISLPG